MLNLFCGLVVAALVAALTACSAHGTTVMDSTVLTTSGDSLVNRSVLVSGCLTKDQHVAFLSSCGSTDSHISTSVHDPNNVVLAALPGLREKSLYRVKGKFRGTLRRAAHGTTAYILFSLDSAEGVTEHEP